MTKYNYRDIECNIGYNFKNKNLLKKALTHSSYVNENNLKPIDSNERLEFLGDAILGLIVSEHLYKKYSSYTEGKLTKLRAKIVCEDSLAYVAKKIGLGKYMLLGKGEEVTGGRNRKSILADAVEAVIAAIYLDSDYLTSMDILIRNFGDEIEKAISKGILFIDYKTQLQEKLQKKGNSKIDYKIIKEEGPDHGKIFYMQVLINNKKVSLGKGKNKKEAEQNAAQEALKVLGEF